MDTTYIWILAGIVAFLALGLVGTGLQYFSQWGDRYFSGEQPYKRIGIGLIIIIWLSSVPVSLSTPLFALLNNLWALGVLFGGFTWILVILASSLYLRGQLGYVLCALVDPAVWGLTSTSIWKDNTKNYRGRVDRGGRSGLFF